MAQQINTFQNWSQTLGTAASGRTALGLDAVYQPLDADLTAIAALATAAYGRSLLTLANQAALYTALGTGPQDATHYLRGDGTWATVAGGGGGATLGANTFTDVQTYTIPASAEGGGNTAMIRQAFPMRVSANPAVNFCTQELLYGSDYNSIFQWGWNVSAGGGRVDNTKPQSMFSLEYRWPTGGPFPIDFQIESHLIHVKSGGEANRIWSFISQDNSPGIVEGYITGSSFQFRYPDSGAHAQGQWVQATPDVWTWNGLTNSSSLSVDQSASGTISLAASSGKILALSCSGAGGKITLPGLTVDPNVGSGTFTWTYALALHNTLGLTGSVRVNSGSVTLDAVQGVYVNSGQTVGIYLDASTAAGNFIVRSSIVNQTGSFYFGLGHSGATGSVFAQTKGTNKLEIKSNGQFLFQPDGAGTTVLTLDANGVGFYGTAGGAKPSIVGSRGGNAALADLLTKLAARGLITDGTSA